jgi:hypothetical protein
VAVLGVSAQQRTSGQVVAGAAVDATGAVLPRAQVTLTTTSNAAVQTTTTDAAGAFVGGGAQGDLLRTETHMQMVASLAWTWMFALVSSFLADGGPWRPQDSIEQ